MHKCEWYSLHQDWTAVLVWKGVNMYLLSTAIICMARTLFQCVHSVLASPMGGNFQNGFELAAVHARMMLNSSGGILVSKCHCTLLKVNKRNFPCLTTFSAIDFFDPYVFNLNSCLFSVSPLLGIDNNAHRYQPVS